MMTRNICIAFGLLAFFSLGLLSCDEGAENKNDNFDRAAMLQNYADNLIIPAYTNLLAGIQDLENAAADFTNNPSVESLEPLQTAWETAYLRWQYANAYNFGPAGEEGLRKGLIEEIGIFPVSTSKIENAISTGTYDLSDFNRDARGFLAIEYMIFNDEDNGEAIVSLFENQKRTGYLLDLIGNVKTRVEDVLSAWNNGYRNEFISNAGTDVGSSTSQLYNEFVRSFESIKNFKIGLPLGKRPGQTQTEPARVEAYYSGKSVEMFKVHFNAIENIWYGKTNDGTEGTGFKAYLGAVEGGPALVASTESQLSAVHTVMDAVPDTPALSEQLQTSTGPLDALHTELQKITRYFKSDMSSLLGIAITFSSGDGD